MSKKTEAHQMKLDPAPFDMIKAGQKTIELRLFDEKRQRIRVGDTILFVNNATGERLRTGVVKLHKYRSFAELYKALPLLQCGYTAETLAKADPSDMELYYSPADQQRYGVVGIELRVDETGIEREGD